jgi:ABC-type transport system involved in multi-copper enzyme maturation permease subunit
MAALRAVVGTALFLGVLAVFSLAVGVILRRSAAAITLVAALVLLPQLFTQMVPDGSGNALVRVSPAAGLAIQQTIRETPAGGQVAIAPWLGFAVLCGYAVVALGVAYLLLRRRDS